jgi:hypothetical protein
MQGANDSQDQGSEQAAGFRMGRMPTNIEVQMLSTKGIAILVQSGDGVFRVSGQWLPAPLLPLRRHSIGTPRLALAALRTMLDELESHYEKLSGEGDADIQQESI